MAKIRRRASALRQQLYPLPEQPASGFNGLVLDWLAARQDIAEHSTPAAFDTTRLAYEAMVETVGEANRSWSRKQIHRKVLSNLTNLLFGIDLSGELAHRLPAGLINVGGTRSTVSQGVMKNMGENFVNVLVYALADLLKDQDEVLVDKGMPPMLRKALTINRRFEGTRECKDLRIQIECDFCIFSRHDPTNAIVGSAKTRLKEVFHVGTMWKLLFDMLGDAYCCKKWGLSCSADELKQMNYIFATSDSIREGGTNSQGPDIKPTGARNLICADASFFDYVFVSKSGIDYVSDQLIFKAKESLFHELGCIIDMVEQKFPTLRLP